VNTPPPAVSPLELLICTTTFAAPGLARGGMQLAVRAQVERLAARHRVTVVAPYRLYPPLGRYAAKRREVPPGPAAERERIGPHELRIVRPRQVHVPGLWPLLDPYFMVRGILAAAKESGRPDLLHGHWLHPQGAATAAAARALGRPVVLTAHGRDVARFDWPDGAYYQRHSLAAANAAACVICVSRAIRDRLAEVGVPGERLVVIPNGVDLARFTPRERAAARAELAAVLGPAIAAGECGPLLVFAGELLPVKQADRLIRSVAQLSAARDTEPVALALAGAGPEEDRLRALAHELGLDDAVVFAGQRPHAEMPAWLAAADLLVLPSESEGLPLVIPEALAAGTPVVASRVGGIPECLEDGVTGVLVPPHGDAELAHGIRAALARSWDRAGLVAAARLFGWDAQVARIEAVYREALAGQRA
jgi:glycosyltransferase involved in cell wall biosynthesis